VDRDLTPDEMAEVKQLASQLKATREGGAGNEPDEFGYVAGQVKPAKDGSLWKYIGNNQWAPAK
jgi:hypothetical protein